MSIHWSDRIRTFVELKLISYALILGYGWLLWRVADWFMALKDPTATQSAFVTLMVGITPVMLNFFLEFHRSPKAKDEP
jgi:hypothetical protein